MHGACPDAEGEAHLAVHVPTQERVHLLRERPPAGSIPARDRDHEGLRRRLESRGRRRTEPPRAIPNPITPPPQPTGRTENPSSCLLYSCYEQRGTCRFGPPLGAWLTKPPIAHRRTVPPVLSDLRPLTIFSNTAASDGPAHHGP